MDKQELRGETKHSLAEANLRQSKREEKNVVERCRVGTGTKPFGCSRWSGGANVARKADGTGRLLKCRECQVRYGCEYGAPLEVGESESFNI